MSGMQMAMMGVGGASAALSAFNSPVSTYNQITGPGKITSDPVTCTPSGGTPAYSYSWTRVSGSIFTIGNATGATTTFSTSAPGVALYSGVYRCTVTDSASGNVIASPDVTIELERT